MTNNSTVGAEARAPPKHASSAWFKAHFLYICAQETASGYSFSLSWALCPEWGRRPTLRKWHKCRKPNCSRSQEAACQYPFSASWTLCQEHGPRTNTQQVARVRRVKPRTKTYAPRKLHVNFHSVQAGICFRSVGQRPTLTKWHECSKSSCSRSHPNLFHIDGPFTHYSQHLNP